LLSAVPLSEGMNVENSAPRRWKRFEIHARESAMMSWSGLYRGRSRTASRHCRARPELREELAEVSMNCARLSNLIPVRAEIDLKNRRVGAALEICFSPETARATRC
jgi:hypothetical protein